MKHNKKYLIGTFTAFVLLLSMTGCKTTKKVGTVDAVSAKVHKEFFDSMQEQAFKFETLSAKMQVELNIPKKKMNSRVDLKIIKDESLSLSVQPFLGIEAVRIEMNKDSILILDRLNKRYVLENYANLKEQTPIAFNFYNLQALFVNHIFLPGEQGISSKQYNKFLLKQDGGKIEAKVKDSMGLLYSFWADGEEKLLSTHVTDTSGEYALQWDYQDFRIIGNQPFPMVMDTKLLLDGSFKGGMKFNFSRIQTDESFKINFSAPDKYKRITFAQILQSIK